MKAWLWLGLMLAGSGLPLYATWADHTKWEADRSGEISAWIEQLGAATYKEREAAMEALWNIGEPALQELEKASADKDPEVRTRAKELLLKIRQGIRPDWSPELQQKVSLLGSLQGEAKIRVLAFALGERGEKALPLLMTHLDGKEGEKVLELIKPLLKNERVLLKILTREQEPEGIVDARLLALAALESGRPGDLATALSAKHLAKDDANKLIRQGVEALLTLQQTKKIQPMREGAERLVAAAPEEARFLYALAVAMVFTGEEEQGTELARQASKLNADDEPAHYQAADFLMKFGQPSLAEREWLQVLRIETDSAVYDINAYMRLAAINEKREDYGMAASLMRKGLTRFRKAKEEGSGMAMIGADDEKIEGEIKRLQKLANRKGLPLTIRIQQEMRKQDIPVYETAVETANLQMDVGIEPHGFRLFDEAPATMRYLSEKKGYTIVLNGSPGGKPRKAPPPESGDTILVHMVDRYYLFRFPDVDVDAELIQTIDVDYTVRVEPREQFETWRDVEVILNGKPYTWDQLKEGVRLDLLPEKFDVIVRGINEKGLKMRAEMSVDPERYLLEEDEEGE